MAYAVAGSAMARWRGPDYAGSAAGPLPRRKDFGLDEEAAKPRRAGGLLRAVRGLLAGARA